MLVESSIVSRLGLVFVLSAVNMRLEIWRELMVEALPLCWGEATGIYICWMCTLRINSIQ